MTKRFDIVLVLAHFRAATAYLSIIRHLSPRARVAVVPAKVDESYLRKTITSQQTFIGLCERFGAEVVPQGTHAEADLMIVQQYPYPPGTAAEIQSSVPARRRIGLMGFATAGLEKHDSFLPLFDIQKVYVPSLRFMRFLLAERRVGDRYAGVDAVEVGLPFKRYPIFPEFEADYVIAAPTVFSFHEERGKHHFLRTILKLLEQIPASARIAYKTHNGNERDYFAPSFHYRAARTLRGVPRIAGVLASLATGMPAALRRHLQAIQTGMLHLTTLERAVPMTRITPYADISLEAFLPGVRGGVIGGLSNTIWGTLYSELPFYNCVDARLRGGKSDLLPSKSSDALLDLNLRYFGVPYCDGDLARGARGGDIVTEQDRQGDILREIESDLGR